MYLCQVEAQKVTLQAEALIELRAGYSPDEFLARKALGERDTRSNDGWLCW